MWQVEGGQVEGVAVADARGQVLRDLDQHALPVALVKHLVRLGPDTAAAAVRSEILPVSDNHQVLCDLNEHALPVALVKHLISLGPDTAAAAAAAAAAAVRSRFCVIWISTRCLSRSSSTSPALDLQRGTTAGSSSQVQDAAGL
jgi:hypothetical protein